MTVIGQEETFVAPNSMEESGHWNEPGAEVFRTYGVSFQVDADGGAVVSNGLGNRRK